MDGWELPDGTSATRPTVISIIVVIVAGVSQSAIMKTRCKQN